MRRAELNADAGTTIAGEAMPPKKSSIVCWRADRHAVASGQCPEAAKPAFVLLTTTCMF